MEYEEGKAFAEKYGMDFIETSAKTNENVFDAFENSVRTILSKAVDDPSVLKTNKGENIELRKEESENSYIGSILSWC